MSRDHHDPDHDRLRSLLGAHALGQLDGTEEQDVVLHLIECGECRAELDEIAPAADGLRELRARAGGWLQPPVAPAGLRENVLESVRLDARRGRRRRRLLFAAGAAVAAVVASAAVVGVEVLRNAGDTPSARVEPVPVVEADRTVTASADVIPHRWGVELELHARGLVSGERYLVTVQSADGRDHEAGEFVGTGARELDCHLSSSVPLSRATGFVVSDRAGAVHVSGHFSADRTTWRSRTNAPTVGP